MKTARNIAIIAAVAAAVAILPSGKPAVNVLLTVIGIAFFAAVAMLAYRLYMENRFPADTLRALEQRGHAIHRWGPWNEQAGHAHGITIGSQGILSGGADPRSDGAAIGY